MTINKLTDERINNLLRQYDDSGFNDTTDAELMSVLRELQERRKASAEPVISVIYKDGWPEPNSAAPIVGAAKLPDGVHEFYTAPPAPVVPEGLRIALSNAGIAAPESDEMLHATHEKYVQMLVTWVRERKPFQPAPVATDNSTCKYCGGTGYFRWQRSGNTFPCPCVGCDLPATPKQG